MKCEIIKDLIPLCSEGLCSEESRIAVEEHIKTCETCRLLYEKIPETEEKIQAEGAISNLCGLLKRLYEAVG